MFSLLRHSVNFRVAYLWCVVFLISCQESKPNSLAAKLDGTTWFCKDNTSLRRMEGNSSTRIIRESEQQNPQLHHRLACITTGVSMRKITNQRGDARVYIDCVTHRSWECDRVTSHAEPRRILQSKRLCFNCIEAEHSASQCHSRTLCVHCKQRPHLSIWRTSKSLEK